MEAKTNIKLSLSDLRAELLAGVYRRLGEIVLDPGKAAREAEWERRMSLPFEQHLALDRVERAGKRHGEIARRAARSPAQALAEKRFDAMLDAIDRLITDENLDQDVIDRRRAFVDEQLYWQEHWADYLSEAEREAARREAAVQ